MAEASIGKNWVAGMIAAVLISYFYIVFEWLFFITKPSMLNSLELNQQLAVLFISPVPLLVPVLVSSIFFSVLASLLMLVRLRWPGKLVFVAIPAFVLCCILFLLIDNFTYSILGFASFSESPFNRILYSILLVGLLFFSARFLFGQIFNYGWLTRNLKFASAVSVVFLATTAGFVALSQSNNAANAIVGEVVNKPASSFKNILILASDGIDSKRMSLYGYKRKTTPYLDSIRKNLRIYENHFTNAARTTGSVGSLLSGKLPTTTRLIFRPDILTGADVYQHLPGLLKANGFDNGDISVRHYADASDINMKNAFRYANERNLDEEGLQLPDWFARRYLASSYFIEETYNRISGRLLHVSGIRTMSNPFMAVTQPERNRRTDRVRIDNLKSFISTSKRPFFAHVHLFGTHGPRFPSSTTKFTAGKKQNEDWMDDFYDDSILQYDGYIKEVVDFLKEQGVYDNTLLILNTDHGFRWAINEPLPLIFRFPNDKYAGVVSTNSQRLDIAPSILDYLKIPKPSWIEGTSLFSAESKKMKPIFIVDRRPSETVNGWRQVPSPKPPFYTLGSLTMIYCDRMFTLDLTRDASSGNFLPQTVANHTSPCKQTDVPGDDEARAMMINHLRLANYDLPADLK